MSRKPQSSNSPKVASRSTKRDTRKPSSHPSVSPRKVTRPTSAADAAPLSRDASKQARLTELLRRPEGATMDQMMALTGWQSHSVRGVISGTLKKKLGLEIVSHKNEAGLRSYHLTLKDAS